MFLTLLLTTLLIALATSTLLALLFRRPMRCILERILSDPIHSSWLNYMVFAIYVVGISSGVRVWDLESYISPDPGTEGATNTLALNADRWVLEVYRTLIGTLQGVAWLLLVFFVFALLGFVVIRLGELKQSRQAPD